MPIRKPKVVFFRFSFRAILYFLTSSVLIFPVRRNITSVCYLKMHSVPENLKKSRSKKLVKTNKSTSRKNFLTKIHFLRFQKWPKINFWTEKKFKTEYFPWKLKFYLIFMENIQKNFFVKLIYLIARDFWYWLFLIFWPTVVELAP